MAEHDSEEFILELPDGVQAASLARHFVTEHSDSLPAQLVDDAVVIVSELVTNAVLHGKPAITLRMSLNPPLIGAAIDDAGDMLLPVEPLTPATTATHGRGLLIVDQLASQWGVDAHHPGPGKTVWFHIAPDTPT